MFYTTCFGTKILFKKYIIVLQLTNDMHFIFKIYFISTPTYCNIHHIIYAHDY